MIKQIFLLIFFPIIIYNNLIAKDIKFITIEEIKIVKEQILDYTKINIEKMNCNIDNNNFIKTINTCLEDNNITTIKVVPNTFYDTKAFDFKLTINTQQYNEHVKDKFNPFKQKIILNINHQFNIKNEVLQAIMDLTRNIKQSDNMIIDFRKYQGGKEIFKIQLNCLFGIKNEKHCKNIKVLEDINNYNITFKFNKTNSVFFIELIKHLNKYNIPIIIEEENKETKIYFELINHQSNKILLEKTQ